MKRLTLITVILTLALPLVALADPAPFGMELNKSTRQQVLKMYPSTRTGTNQYSGGPMYDLETANIEFEGLQALSVIFSTDDRLLAVLATFHKNDFNRLNNIMQEKYRLVSSKIPFVGNKTATYREDQTEISLDAPHLSFQMSLNYISESLLKTYREQSQQKSAQKRERQSDAL